MSSRKKILLKYLLCEEMDDDSLLDMLAVPRLEKHVMFQTRMNEGYFENLIKNHLRADSSKFVDFLVLARALHSLSRIGDDLFVEPHGNLLALRTVNIAQSAYAVFTFFECFFSSYNYSGTDDDDDNSFKCKISMKSCLSVFKTPTCMDKQVEWCQIRFERDGTQLVFKIRYVYGSTKTHFLPVLENETLEANYGKNNTVNRLCITPKVLSAAVRNFRPNIDEITLSVSTDKATLKTHVDNSDSKKSVRTELCLFAGEFEAFSVGIETSVTFCLKELKAVLAFAEPTNLPIIINFDTHGRPVVFVINNSGLYEANYVVSTLNINCNAINTSQRSEISVSGKSCPVAVQQNSDTNKRKRNESEDFDFPAEVLPNKSIMANNSNGQFHNTSKNMNRRNVSNMSQTKVKPQTNLDDPSTSVCNLTGIDPLLLAEEMEAEEMGDEIPPSPPPPIVRTVFGRCFNVTFHNRMMPGYDQVLAYDSDGMEDPD